MGGAVKIRGYYLGLVVMCGTSVMAMERPYDSIINLGGDCQVAYQMKKHKLRTCALPFDRVNCPPEAIIKLLELKFEGFLEKEHLAYTEATSSHIHETVYDMILRHDFKVIEDFLAWEASTEEEEYRTYDEVKKRYDRRVARFLNLIDTSKCILFIRKRASEEQAKLLVETIKKVYPELDFLLVILGGKEEHKKDWKVDHIRNFFLRQLDPYKWSGDDEAWREIFFDELGLESMMQEGAQDVPIFGRETSTEELEALREK